MTARGLVLLAALALAAAATWWLQADLDAVDEPRPEALREGPDAYMTQFTATRMDADGRPRYRLRADAMRHYPGRDTTELDEPHIEFFQTPGMPPWHARARHGTVTGQEDRITLTEQVRVFRQPGAGLRPITLETELLHVLPHARYAESDRAVRLLSTGTEVNGVGMRAYLDEERIELLSEARGRYETKIR